MGAPPKRNFKLYSWIFLMSLALFFYFQFLHSNTPRDTEVTPTTILNYQTHEIPHKLEFEFLKAQEREKSGLVGHDRMILDQMESRNASLIFQGESIINYFHPHSLRLKDKTIPTAVILITSTAKDAKTRNNIRESWYQWGEEASIKIFFFIGIHPKNENFLKEYNALEEESIKYGDLIVISFKEEYYRLVIKVLRMMEWYLNSYRPRNRPQFFIKADQDLFINIPKLKSHLQNVASPDHYIGGHYYVNNVIQTDPKSKFYLSNLNYWMLGGINLPDFVLGPRYVLNEKTVETLFKASFSEPLFPFEDAYFTGYLRTKLNVSGIDSIPMVFTSCSLKLCKILSQPNSVRNANSITGIEDSELLPQFYKIVQRNN